jgi:hypothetical protein
MDLSQLAPYTVVPLIIITIIASNVCYFYLNEDDINSDRIRKKIMTNIIGTMFIVFGLLKLSNFRKFVEIYPKYDLIAEKYPTYAYIYPIIELYLGYSFLKMNHIPFIYYFSMIIVFINLLGIFISLLSGVSISCGCIGGYFNLPLSNVSFVENLIMFFMIYLLF